jgi:hypothetical protein
MKLLIEITYEIDGVPPDVGMLYMSKIPACIVSEDEDGTEGWALLTSSVQVIEQ